MSDRKLIIAEMRAGELLVCLQAAVNGDSHWRVASRELLRQIDELELPPPHPPASLDYLLEIDARKRIAEIVADIKREARYG